MISALISPSQAEIIAIRVAESAWLGPCHRCHSVGKMGSAVCLHGLHISPATYSVSGSMVLFKSAFPSNNHSAPLK